MTSSADPFAAVRVNKSQPKSTNVQPNNENDPFASVRIKPAEGFPFLKEVGRHTARTASRIAETVGGIPGDISSLIQSGVFSGLENLLGHKLSQEGREKAKIQRPPTSAELKQTSEELTGGLTKAKDASEELADEAVETITSLLGPIKFRKALGIGLGAVSAKKGAEILGLEKGPQEAAKLGTMFLLTALNPGGASKYAASQYDKAAQLSKGASIQAHNFQGHLQNLVKDLEKGVSTASKNAVMKPAQELINKVHKGKILVQDLTTAKRDINSLMGDPTLLKREKNLLKVVAKEVDQAIKPYEKINPQFSKAYRPANEIFGAVAQGNKAANFIKSILGDKHLVAAGLGEVALGHPEFVIPTLGTAAGAFSAAKSYDFLSRISKSPELRKYYGKLLLSAAKEDAASVRTYADKIEKTIENQ